ncbi:hypothetical protein D3C85_674320 [compost metagenome]
MLVTQRGALGFARCNRQAFQLGASGLVRSGQCSTLRLQGITLLLGGFADFLGLVSSLRLEFAVRLMLLPPGLVFFHRLTRILTGTLGFADDALLAGCILLSRSTGLARSLGLGVDSGGFRLTGFRSSFTGCFGFWTVVHFHHFRLGEFASLRIFNRTCSCHGRYLQGIWL